MTIQDLVELPPLILDDELITSSHVPMMARSGNHDECMSTIYGRELEVDTRRVRRFKMIETQGDRTVERLMVGLPTPGVRHPTELMMVDVRIHSPTAVFQPLQCLNNKYWLSQSMCSQGIQDDWSPRLEEHFMNLIRMTNNYYQPDLRDYLITTLERNRPQLRLASRLDDGQMADMYNTVLTDLSLMDTNLGYPSKNLEELVDKAVAAIPNIDGNDLLTKRGLLEELPLKALKPFLGSQYDQHLYTPYLESHPFVGKSNVHTVDSMAQCRAALHRVIASVHSAPYTHMYLTYAPKTGFVTCHFYNIYTGQNLKIDNESSIDNQPLLMDPVASVLLDQLDAWISLHAVDAAEIKLAKPFDENVYITVVDVTGHKTRFLMDAFTYGLCTWNIVGL
jgi:hypothetical protein